MLIKMEIDGRQTEVTVIKITLIELYSELIPEIKERIGALNKADGEMKKKLSEILTEENSEAFIIENIKYIMGKTVKHSNLKAEEVEQMSVAEITELVKAVLKLSFGDDWGKLFAGAKNSLAKIIPASMFQVIRGN